MKKKQFTILADVPPPPDEKNLECYKMSGIDTYVLTEDYINYDQSPEEYIEVLRRLDHSGLNVLIRGLGNLEKNYYNKFEGLNFCDYACVKGFYITDEPGAKQFEFLKIIHAEWRNKNYPEMHWHINLLPSYASEEQLQTISENDKTAYENYIDMYIKNVLSYVPEKKDIGFDHYPLRFKNGKYVMTENWLYDLFTVAVAAQRANIGYCACIQSFTDNDAWRKLTSINEIRFQVFTSLAFGVNMFEFFIYNSINFEEGDFIGMVKTGEKTEYYEYVKQTILELRALENYYLQYNWRGIQLVKGNNNRKDNNNQFAALKGKTLEKIDEIENVYTDEDIIIGIFENKKKTALMIVNFNDPVKNIECHAQIVLNKTKFCICHRGQNIQEMTEKSLYFDLKSGDGIFVEIN